ncbi:MAG: potassium transporter Kup [Salinibacter sp.]
MSTTESSNEPSNRRRLLILSLAAIGVVYGDIGTSPLYAIRESINEYNIMALPEPGGVLEQAQATAIQTDVLGILSLIFWSLIVVISVKYLILVLQADNQGSGGIMALAALISPPHDRPERWTMRWVFMLLGLFGAALLWGDSMITPAISVVSAVEGLKVVTTAFKPYIIPITIGILVGLFLFQKRGTAGVGAIFGPITSVWFLFLGVIGIFQIMAAPGVFTALNPAYAVKFFAQNGWEGFFVLGSVFLVVTGGEALYADIGHFGKFPIRLTWFGFVLPSLLLNYFGQGALILKTLPEGGTITEHTLEVLEQPFFHMTGWMPEWMLYVQVALATAATIIASQAVISGAFSLTSQAVQLGYLPRMEIRHTSEEHIGQIFMPAVNWALMIACIGLVIGFSIPEGKTSSNLAAAYGVAVTTMMVFTTLMYAVVTRYRWKWSFAVVVPLTVGLMIVDLSFWGATLRKIPEGGWFPLVVAAGFFLIMITWKRGRRILADRLSDKIIPHEEFLERVREAVPKRVSGTAVFMDSNPKGTPQALLQNFEHNKILHERVVILTLLTQETPHVPPEKRFDVKALGENVYRLTIDVGFAEDPNVPAFLRQCEIEGEGFDLDDTTFFLGRETLLATEKPGMALWRERLFAWMSQNAQRAAEYFHIPSDRVVEIGTQVEL